MAIALRSPSRGCVFHSDRGSHYCSHDHQKILRDYGLQLSMSGKGNCYENAIVDTFFKTIKVELVWRRTGGNPPPSRNHHLSIHQRLL
jgi:putative transposase